MLCFVTINHIGNNCSYGTYRQYQKRFVQKVDVLKAREIKSCVYGSVQL